jgi:hypothetical protein
MDNELIIIEGNKNPSYSLRHFKIKINFYISELRNDDPNSIDDYAQFLHEYTHYLQTVTTINGISALLSYIDKLLNMSIEIGINIYQRKNQSREIIERYKDEFVKFYNRLYWERKPKQFSITSTKPKFITQPIYNPIIKKQSIECFIYNPYDKLFHHVSTLMLRENMAMMANFSIRGIGQDAVMDYVNNKTLNFKYWLIFYYFLYTYPDITNVIKFTYYFCELALMVINPGEFVEKIMNDIDYLIKNEKYENEEIFFEKLSKKQVNKISEDGNLMFILIDNIKLALSKIIEDNDIYKPIYKILELAEKGLKNKQIHATIFQDVMDTRWLHKMAKEYLSPIIFQPNSIIAMLFDDNEFQNLLCILFGVTIISEKIIKHESIDCCPFFSEIPICKATTNEIEEICSTNPLDITPFPTGGCLFYNTALILGLLKKEELEKYINDSDYS